MAGRIDYDIENTSLPKPVRRHGSGSSGASTRVSSAAGRGRERLRIALPNVDYVTSFELPFRLLLVRAPQLIADVRETLQLSRKAAVFNGKRYGCVYSLKQDLQAVPEAFHYRGKPHSSRRCNGADGGPVPADCPGESRPGSSSAGR